MSPGLRGEATHQPRDHQGGLCQAADATLRPGSSRARRRHIRSTDRTLRRIASQITRHQQAHRLRHVINELAARLPEAERDRPEMRELMSYGCQTRMHVVQLLAPQLDYENHTKDVDFSPAGIQQRWDAGYAHTKAVLAREPWVGQFDALSGVHDAGEFRALAAE